MNGQSNATHDLGNVDQFELWFLNRSAFDECSFCIDPAKHHLKRIRQVSDPAHSLGSVPRYLGSLDSGSLGANDGLLDARLPTTCGIIQIQTKCLLIELHRLGIIAHMVMAFAHHRPITNRVQEPVRSHFECTIGTCVEFTECVFIIRLVILKEQVVVLLLG